MRGKLAARSVRPMMGKLHLRFHLAVRFIMAPVAKERDIAWLVVVRIAVSVVSLDAWRSARLFPAHFAWLKRIAVLGTVPSGVFGDRIAFPPWMFLAPPFSNIGPGSALAPGQCLTDLPPHILRNGLAFMRVDVAAGKRAKIYWPEMGGIAPYLLTACAALSSKKLSHCDHPPMASQPS